MQFLVSNDWESGCGLDTLFNAANLWDKFLYCHSKLTNEVTGINYINHSADTKQC